MPRSIIRSCEWDDPAPPFPSPLWQCSNLKKDELSSLFFPLEFKKKTLSWNHRFFFSFFPISFLISPPLPKTLSNLIYPPPLPLSLYCRSGCLSAFLFSSLFCSLCVDQQGWMKRFATGDNFQRGNNFKTRRRAWGNPFLTKNDFEDPKKKKKKKERKKKRKKEGKKKGYWNQRNQKGTSYISRWKLPLK